MATVWNCKSLFALTLTLTVASLLANATQMGNYRDYQESFGSELAEFMSSRPTMSNMSCNECNTIVRDLVSGLKLNSWLTLSLNKDRLKKLCIRYLPNVSYKAYLCPLLVGTYINQIQKFAKDGHLDDLCEMMTVCPSTSQPMTSSYFKEAGHDVTDGKHGTVARESSRYVSSRPRSRSRFQLQPLTFVQISDIHLDMAYAQGSPSSCSHKICCKPGIDGKGEARRFGEYRCDSVNETVTVILDSIRRLDPPPSFFVYVGDSSPHSIGEETLQKKVEDNSAVLEMIIDYFRTIAPIFPTVGNHEMFPESIYNRRTAGSQAILNSVSESWPLLFQVPFDQRENIRKHAYYTTLVKPGLRIMSTNSLNGYTLNLQAIWSMMDSVEQEQRDFVRATLENARRSNEKVIHISHIKPSHTQTYPMHTRIWERIADEFNDVIILQLYGHEHADNFVLSSSFGTSQLATGVFMAAPSITPFVYYTRGTNPSYRVFKLDPNTFAPLDYDQYYVNLRKANDYNQVAIQKHYTFTEEYEVPDLSPASFQAVAKRLEMDYDYYMKYERNVDVLSDHQTKCSRRNVLCRRILTCAIRNPTYYRYIPCLFTG